MDKTETTGIIRGTINGKAKYHVSLDTSPAPTDLLGLGDTVWMKYYDDDQEREAIEAVRVTGLGYEGFWYSGSPDKPRAMEALARWDRFGVDVFFSREEAEG